MMQRRDIMGMNLESFLNEKIKCQRTELYDKKEKSKKSTASFQSKNRGVLFYRENKTLYKTLYGLRARI